MPFEIICANFLDDTITFKPRFCTHIKTIPLYNLLKKQGHRYCGLCYEQHGIETYNKITKCVKDKECILLTTKKEFMELNMGTSSKIKLIGKCGHEIETIYNTLLQSTALCPPCVNIHRSKIRTEFYQNDKEYSQNIEIDGNKIFRKYLSNNFEIIRIASCLSDMLIKPKNIKDDIWLPVQLKATMKKDIRHSYKFDIKRNDYTNTVLICICISEQKFWIFEGVNIPKTDFINIFTKKENSKSKNNNALVKNDNIVAYMTNLYINSTINQTKSTLSIPIAPKHKLEYKYKLIREDKFENIFNFEYPDADSCVYDFIVNKLKVQEKVAFPEVYNDKVFRVNLRKTKTQSSKMPYNEKDNDIYWFHIPDQDIFYVIPTNILVKLKYLTTDNQPGKTALLLYPNYIQKKGTRLVLSYELNQYIFDYNNKDDMRKVHELFYKN